jgi:hypothetical protein
VRVTSALRRFQVQPPRSPADRRVGELLLGNEQGRLLYFLGSDSNELNAGNMALDDLRDRYATHPLSVYARMVQGINDGRDFKTLTVDKALKVRPARTKESIELLRSVIGASVADQGVDNITLNMVMRRLSVAQAKAGNQEDAEQTADRMVQVFEGKGLNQSVIRIIRQQAAETKAGLKDSPQ